MPSENQPADPSLERSEGAGGPAAGGGHLYQPHYFRSSVLPPPRSGHQAPSQCGNNPVLNRIVDGRKCYTVRGTSFEVDEHYDLIKAIGVGAYGLVCSAMDLRLVPDHPQYTPELLELERRGGAVIRGLGGQLSYFLPCARDGNEDEGGSDHRTREAQQKQETAGARGRESTSEEARGGMLQPHSFVPTLQYDPYLRPELRPAGAARTPLASPYVAIKKISRLYHDLIDGRRVLRECRILQYLKGHENIIRLLDILHPRYPTQCRDIYLVTELMETDLQLVLHTRQPLSEDHIRYIMYQLFKCLLWAHSSGVIHRDLKPGNLLLSAYCQVKVCDFGLSRGGVLPFRTASASYDRERGGDGYTGSARAMQGLVPPPSHYCRMRRVGGDAPAEAFQPKRELSQRRESYYDDPPPLQVAPRAAQDITGGSLDAGDDSSTRVKVTRGLYHQSDGEKSNPGTSLSNIASRAMPVSPLPTAAPDNDSGQRENRRSGTAAIIVRPEPIATSISSTNNNSFSNNKGAGSRRARSKDADSREMDCRPNELPAPDNAGGVRSSPDSCSSSSSSSSSSTGLPQPYLHPGPNDGLLDLTDYVITRYYRPPELLIMSAYSVAADMWSAGCILAEMLLYRPLFVGKDYLDQLNLLLRTDIYQLRGMPQCPTQLDEMFLGGAEGKMYIRQVLFNKKVTQPFGLGRASGDAGSQAATPTQPTASATYDPLLLRDRLLGTELAVQLSPVGADLLSRLLCFDPRARLTALEALRHPFFSKVYQAKEEYARDPVMRAVDVSQPLDELGLGLQPRLKGDPNEADAAAETTLTPASDKPVHYDGYYESEEELPALMWAFDQQEMTEPLLRRLFTQETSTCRRRKDRLMACIARNGHSGVTRLPPL